MKRKNIITAIIFLSILTISSGCATDNFKKSSADWSHSFVVWDGYIYHVGDDYVSEIGEKIGKVTKYSDLEGTYTGNFSNTYKKGTKFYSIKGISTDEAIAIREEDGKFRKAHRNGKYGEK